MRELHKRRLHKALRSLRDRAGVSRQDAAEALRCSPSRIGHIETGRNVPREDEIRTLLDLYGAPEKTATLATLANQIHSGTPSPGESLSRLADTLTGFDTYLALEQGAHGIVEWATMSCPGLLQTEDYAAATMLAGHGYVSPYEVDRRVRQRMRRQEILQQHAAPRMLALLDESILLRLVGSRTILDGQLAHLLERSHCPTVSIRVVPFDRTYPPALNGPYITLDFDIPDDDGIVYLEDRAGGKVHDDPELLGDYSAITEALLARSADERESRELINRIGSSR